MKSKLFMVNYLVVPGTMEFWLTFHSVGNGKIIPTDFHSIIFQRGSAKSHQPAKSFRNHELIDLPSLKYLEILFCIFSRICFHGAVIMSLSSILQSSRHSVWFLQILLYVIYEYDISCVLFLFVGWHIPIPWPSIDHPKKMMNIPYFLRVSYPFPIIFMGTTWWS